MCLVQVVVDLGCGTGILSMFCAKLGGAKQVSLFLIHFVIK